MWCHSRFEEWLEKACCAPLEQAATAFAELGADPAAGLQTVSPAQLACHMHCNDKHWTGSPSTMYRSLTCSPH